MWIPFSLLLSSTASRISGILVITVAPVPRPKRLNPTMINVVSKSILNNDGFNPATSAPNVWIKRPIKRIPRFEISLFVKYYISTTENAN